MRVLSMVIHWLSHLPFSVLHGMATFTAWILRQLLRYRRKVVEDNLRQSFPEVSQQVIQQWVRAYYRHLADTIIETIKTSSMTEAELRRRIRVEAVELGQSIHQAQKGGVIFGTHYGNFEWMLLRLRVWLKDHDIPTKAVYAKLSNPVMDQVVYDLRSKWDVGLIPKRKAMYRALQLMKEGHMMGMIADQSPPKDVPMMVFDFLGRPTPWMPTVAKLAIRAGGPILFADVVREERSSYRIVLIPIEVPQEGLSADEQTEWLTRKVAALLESRIRDQAPYWLWSHRRWKRLPA